MGVYDRIETDNPLLDEIVYNLKLMMSSVILKDQDRADKAETTESLRRYNTYNACLCGRARYELFDYTSYDFAELGISTDVALDYIKNPSSIPSNIKTGLVKKKSQKYIESCQDSNGRYVDINDYYRWLAGSPPINDEGIYLSKEQKEKINEPSLNLSMPVHKLPSYVKILLETSGILNELIEQNPKAAYLKNLNKDIDVYTARQTPKYGKLYMQSDKVEPILYKRFSELLEKNRVYIEKTIDKYCYELFSDYYSRFMMMMIVIQSAIDLISELPDYYIRKELFDIRTIEYFFESNGIEFFPSIPLKYQRKLVKNLNRLCKYKGTYVNIVDITSLFGFPNIEIFKYYLCKERMIDDSTGSYSNTGDIEKDYSLKFLKVPMNEKIDIAARDSSNYLGYNEVTSSDKYWDGPYSHEYVKRKILEHEFNIVKSKYISIDTIYSIVDMSFEMAYFNNMLLYSGIDIDRVTIQIPSLPGVESYRLIDVFCFLYSLMYLYNGVTDEIVIDQSIALKVRGFNFEADLAALSSYINEKGYSAKDLGIEGFTIPESGVLTLSQITSMFINNKNIYDHVIKQMKIVSSKELYLIYQKIYDTLFVTQLNYDQYYIEELGRTASAYKEYLYYKNKNLYNSIVSYEEIEDAEERKEAIYQIVSNVTKTIIDLINNDNIKNIFTNLPIESGEFAKQYMIKIINFFKSYMLDIMNIHTIYKLDKENDVRVLEWYNISYYFNKSEYIRILEKMWNYAHITRSEYIQLLDDIVALLIFNKQDYMFENFKDLFSDMKVNMTKYDKSDVKEMLNMFRNYVRNQYDAYIISDRFKEFKTFQTKLDSISISDDKFIDRYYV